MNGPRMRTGVLYVSLATRTILSNKPHLALTVFISLAFWISFSVLDQLLFFYPFIDFYLPVDALLNFVLSIITSVLMGLVVSMNVYILRSIKHSGRRPSASMISGASLGMISGACASCTSLSFLLVSTFGWAGVVASNVLTNFQIPLRLISIGLLLWALWSSSSRMAASCAVTMTSEDS
jgi:hypothetical protein